MVVDFAVHQPDREDGGIPNPHFHVLCPIRPIEQNGKWGCSSTEFTSWTRTATVSGTQMETLCLTPFPLPTGAFPKRWNTGGRHGRSYAMPSLRKRSLTFVSTTEAMSCLLYTSNMAVVGGKVSVANPNPNVEKMLHMGGLDKYISILKKEDSFKGGMR